MKMCTRLASRNAGVLAAGAVAVLMSATTARAQQSDPFRSVNFVAPVAAASENAAVAADPQAAQAPPATPAEPGYVTFFKNTEFGGLVDVYYAYWSTKEPALYHSFDSQHNSLTPSMVELYFTKTPVADSRVGFKIKTIFGPAARTINGTDDPSLVNVLEGYVSYLAPVGKGLQFDVGKWVTPAGAEVIEAKDDWNYTRGLLFQNAIPYYHAGVRATYNLTDQFTIAASLVNGWNNTQDNNSGKTFIGSVTWKPNMALAVSENYIVGPEKTGTNDGIRQLSDTVATYTLNSQISLIGNYDYAHESSATINGISGTTVSWQGIAGYLKYQATPMIAVVPRLEYFNDANGNQTGAQQKITDFTLTLEFKAADNCLFRVEYRGDFSNEEGGAPVVPVAPPGFVNSNGTPTKTQNGIVFGFLYNFSTK